MKFIHIADIHLGATPDGGKPWSSERAKEIWRSFQNIIEECNRESVDLLLIAGDLFHRQPLLKELKEVNYLFSKLLYTQVVLMAGNHDYIATRSHYRDFKWHGKVHMFRTEDFEYVDVPLINTRVYGFSYCTRDIREPRYDTVMPHGEDGIHILLAHGGDERDVPMDKKKMLQLGFDYIALGHIHKHEIISERMVYPGSLEPLDRSETGAHGYMTGTIERDGSITVRFVPSALREYKKLLVAVDIETTNGSLKDQLNHLMDLGGREHIYQFILQGLRDESIHFDLNEIMTLGNVVEVTDETMPDYDFDFIYRQNKDNIIGLFIQRIQEGGALDDMRKKALYYGMEALLGAREVK